MTMWLISLTSKHQKKCGVEFADINMKITINNYEERGDESDSDSDSDSEYDDKSYETSDDSTVAGDGDLSDELDQVEKDQGQHFNVQEFNDIDEDGSDNGDKGVGEEGVVENIPVLKNEETMHKNNNESGTDDEDASVRTDDPSLESVKTVDDDGESDEPANDPEIALEQQPDQEEPRLPR